MSTPPEPWYNTNWFAAIIGGVISWVTLFISSILSKRNKRKEDRKSFLVLIMQQYSSLFSIIYEGVINQNNIKYKELRKELEKDINIIFLLPDDLKRPFNKLLEIHFTNPEFYENNQIHIHKYIKEIVQKLNEYGVDTFGFN